MRLFGWLRPDLRLLDHVSALEKRLVALEEAQLRREVEWQEVADRIKRYLARLDTHRQREKQREENEHSAPDDITRAGRVPVTDLLTALLRAKYPHSNGG